MKFKEGGTVHLQFLNPVSGASKFILFVGEEEASLG